MFRLLFSWKPIILCKKRQHKNFALFEVGRERAIPITTLAESTLCSKIETLRRQIKTRKRNLKRNHAITDCCARILTVCVFVCDYRGKKLIHKRNMFIRGTERHRLHVNSLRLYSFAHSRHTFNRFQFTPRLPRHFPTQLFRFHFQISSDFFTGGERFSTAIFQALLSFDVKMWKWKDENSPHRDDASLILQFSSSITNGRRFLLFNGFRVNSQSLSRAIKISNDPI